MRYRQSRPAALKTLLGRKFLHAVFDARQSLAVDTLAALAGTLVAGSWLVLLVPLWSRWPRLPDGYSLRWSEQPQPIAMPHFTRYFRAALSADPAVALLCQDRAPQITLLASRLPWHPPVPGRPHRRSGPAVAPVGAGKARHLCDDCAATRARALPFSPPMRYWPAAGRGGAPAGCWWMKPPRCPYRCCVN
ncbi:MAG: tRNA(Met) cytidine acetyltransferase TmcA domain-containing protein [Sodalis sp. (in: enterobacteria)]|uniref:tRNA(Met) cytidine acetyltransferase TmcA domain-containing protein n=1 Tax=Sodalis sp. (in: enterobacteria) TaxID=1898979 RepID=UPI003F2C193C